jgi:hypothetical protein
VVERSPRNTMKSIAAGRAHKSYRSDQYLTQGTDPSIVSENHALLRSPLVHGWVHKPAVRKITLRHDEKKRQQVARKRLPAGEYQRGKNSVAKAST